jgi:predicted nucleotide-binding protein
MRAREPVEAPGESSVNVFLAYATEDENVANAAKDAIEGYAGTKKDIKICVMPWTLSPKVGKSILENVLSKMSECLFGVFLLTPVDENRSGDARRLIARDNVVLETGLFIGARGVDNTFMLLPEKYEVTPSDLQGIIGIKYDYDKVAGIQTSDGRKDAIRQACDYIVDNIHRIMTGPPSSASQPPPVRGQAPAGAGAAQPGSPLDRFNVELMDDAAQDNLTGLQVRDLRRGKLVVHALHGVGQIMAWDLPYVTVRFGSSPPDSVFDIAELFVTPRRV